MNIDIRTPSIDISPALRGYVERRVRAVLGSFADGIDQVTVTLEDVNGPRGGVDKRCSVQVHEPGTEPVVVEHGHEHLFGASAHAIRRAGRAVARRRNRAARSGTWGRRESLSAAS